MTQEGTPEERIPFIPLSDETPDERMEKGFTQFVAEHGYTSKEVHAAYEHLMGVETETEVSAPLLEEMQRLEHNQFPVNRFAEIVELRASLEQAIPNYEDFVEELPVTFEEKNLLHSLVQRQRVGQLQIFVGGELEAKFPVPAIAGDPSASAGSLLGILEHYNDLARNVGQKIEFHFTE